MDFKKLKPFVLEDLLDFQRRYPNQLIRVSYIKPYYICQYKNESYKMDVNQFLEYLRLPKHARTPYTEKEKTYLKT